MKKLIAGFVGKPYGDFIRWLAEHDYEVILYHDKNEHYVNEHISQFQPVDFTSKESAWESLHEAPKPDFLVNTYENAVVPKAWLCEYFLLPGPTSVSAEMATDKFKMRTAFAESCPEFSPRFMLVASWEEIEQFLDQDGISFPLILKPTNLFKSLLVTKNSNREELKQNFQDGLRHIRDIYQKEKVTFEPRFVVEEFLEGPSYSLEVFCDSKGSCTTAPSVVDLVMGRDLGSNDNYNYSRKLPSQVTDSQQQQMKLAAQAAAKALELSSSPGHVELVYTKNGPRIIEIGARTGGYRPRMHQLANGIDLFQAQVDVAQGQLPDLTSRMDNFCAVYELFPQTEGAFAGIESQELIQALPSLKYFSIKAGFGSAIGPSSLGYRAVAVAIFTTGSEETFMNDTKAFESLAKVRVQ